MGIAITAAIAAAGVAAVGGVACRAEAREVRSQFVVSATVRAIAHIELESGPTELKISDADIQRGYVEVTQSTEAVVHSNSQNGFALEILTVAPMLSAMIVGGFDSDLTLGADGGTIVQRWQKPQAVKLSLKFRFELAPGLIAGEYPWPVRLVVRPLEST